MFTLLSLEYLMTLCDFTQLGFTSTPTVKEFGTGVRTSSLLEIGKLLTVFLVSVGTIED